MPTLTRRIARSCYEIDSVPGATERLVEWLREPIVFDALGQEGEGLTLLADLDLAEAQELVAFVDEEHRQRSSDSSDELESLFGTQRLGQ